MFWHNLRHTPKTYITGMKKCMTPLICYWLYYAVVAKKSVLKPSYPAMLNYLLVKIKSITYFKFSLSSLEVKHDILEPTALCDPVNKQTSKQKSSILKSVKTAFPLA